MRRIIEVLPGALLLALLTASIAAAVFKFTRKPQTKKLIAFFAATFLASAYVFIACNILLSITKFGMYKDVSPFSGNYTPFRTIMEYINRGHIGLFFSQVAGNILVTLPFPFVVWFCSRKRNMKRVCLISLIITAVIEPVQILLNVFIGGPTNIIDIDDLILNILGCVLGLPLLTTVNRFYKARLRDE